MKKSNNCFYTTELDFPVTNHDQGITDENMGWARGILADGTPFEAEWWQADEGEGIDIFIPIKDYESNPGVNTLSTTDGISYYHNQMDVYNGGVLQIGMVSEGMEEDLEIIMKYIDYLDKFSIIKFTSNVENGSVEYLTDVCGNTFAKIAIDTILFGIVMAKTSLQFKAFPLNEKKQRYRLI